MPLAEAINVDSELWFFKNPTCERKHHFAKSPPGAVALAVYRTVLPRPSAVLAPEFLKFAPGFLGDSE